MYAPILAHRGNGLGMLEIKLIAQIRETRVLRGVATLESDKL